ncbi:hypothetical protein CspeluHIS016_0303850 [Cutaneotrichosporon spelunceum]|uniref:Translation initiation factor eIF2B subunit beta n=1 Tax=Cutaneotrichosporon spelunceum TaxID=1672016 RepID=A0AAD3TU60_9TREE|nr:hypothetical protein CspeluHIS016_0303850 [Cutaneotrichosporon spelunceum]
MAAEPKADPIGRLVEALVVRLRRRQIVGSRNVALATAALMQNVVRSMRFNTIEELIDAIRSIGKQLNNANPKEPASGNIVRRIIKLIREEYRAAAAAHLSQSSSMPGTPGPSTPGFATPPSYFNYSPSGGSVPGTPMPRPAPNLSNFVAMRHSRVQFERQGTLLDMSAATSNLFSTPPRVLSSQNHSRQGSICSPTLGEANDMEERERAQFAKQAGKLKPILIQAIDEVIGELETTHEDVARGAKEHIHSGEVILTLGNSRTVEHFLKNAYRERQFSVIVLESAPSFHGQAMAAALASHSIPTLLVPDSSLHAVMPRVTKVIFGAHSVSANGGMFALAGSLACTLAARTHAKPVVVVTGQFKFAPSWNLYHEYDTLDFQGPGPVIGYDHTGGGGGYEGVEVPDPHFDYIRPELVNLYATNDGDHPPSYIYRIIKDVFDDEDLVL